MFNRLLAMVGKLHAQRVLARFLRQAKTATRTQSAVLTEKIARNADSAFGRDFGFAQIQSYEDFVRQVPVLRYADLAPYVERVKAGDVSAMFGRDQRVLMFAMTSGTTEKPKYIPVTDAFLKEYRRGWNAFGVKALSDHPEAFLRPIVQVTSRMDEEMTAAGYPCGAITGILAATQKRIVRRFYVSPQCLAYIDDADARYYAIMRLAVAGDVGFMITANPATQLKLARAADTNANRLIRDIADGTLDTTLDIPPDVRRALAPRLRPNPRRATELDRIARREGGLLPKHYWDLGFLANWTGGTMGLYLRDFPHYFGNTPVRDIGLLASEGRMSIPLDDAAPYGVLDIASNFYEFIPAAEYETEHPTVLRSHEVLPDHDYFILLTTSAGFYRYDIGDLIRVRGFCGEAPVIEFLNKGLHTCSLTGEKLTESQAVLAFERTCQALNIDSTLFVLAPQWDEPPYYRLHIEPATGFTHATIPAVEQEMETQLAHANIEYHGKRKTHRLGPVRANLLPARFLTDLDAREATRHRATNEQYKHRYLFPSPGDDADFPIAAPEPATSDAAKP